ncbi:hypothetical protein ACEW7V_01390 [Areca yellow leaf disease phytoplasma]|uniref:hypothetical protein n=1 Tax=Areca yellow leaf disease phytoplasma TaxID=927614 RepID=UPI0035B54A04
MSFLKSVKETKNLYKEAINVLSRLVIAIILLTRTKTIELTEEGTLKLKISFKLIIYTT